jgi:hypothetical protein
MQSSHTEELTKPRIIVVQNDRVKYELDGYSWSMITYVGQPPVQEIVNSMVRPIDLGGCI